MQELLGKNDIDKQAFIAAVEKFTLMHDRHQLDPFQKKYRELIPSKTPGAGEQYAFEVDLDKCTGCKACVTACHSENGLDPDETWRSVGLLQGESGEITALQHITSACHHCLAPACMDGCPTMAFTKDPKTGIVKHLDDQCFGCQYCILKCPYDVPKYNKKRGIVHKCDMCIGRLEVGQAPACVRGCPNGAIRVTLINTADVRKDPKEYVKVPDAPASDYTLPTTRYTTNRIFPANTKAADSFLIEPEHSHSPLVAMLVLTQLSVGAFVAEFIMRHFVYPDFFQSFNRLHISSALGIGLLALVASVFHLGRPHLAFRAFLGFRTSWLSREIIAFGGFAGLAIIYALCYWFGAFYFVLNCGVLIAGILGIGCSVMVYKDTKRPFWDNHMTTIKFLLTSVILGFGLLFLTTTLWSTYLKEDVLLRISASTGQISVRIILAAACLKLLLESAIFLRLMENEISFLKKTAVLMVHHLRKYTFWRFGCGAVGGILLPWGFAAWGDVMPLVGTAIYVVVLFGILLAGELLERYLFFRAVVSLKMPGTTKW